MAGFLLYIGTDIIAIYIFMQQLSTISVSLDEAAIDDGGKATSRYITRIILPLLRPTNLHDGHYKGESEFTTALYPVSIHAEEQLTRSSHDIVSNSKGQYGAMGGHMRGVSHYSCPNSVIFILLQKQIYNGADPGLS